MPKTADIPTYPTPFARVVLDYMWTRRPPINQNQLAIKLGLSRNTVQKWIRGVVPNLDTAIYVLDKLEIPLERLMDAYEQDRTVTRLADEEIERWTRETGQGPEDIRTNDTPDTPDTSDAGVAWTLLIEQAQRDLREAGVDEETIGAVVDRIRQRQIGSEPLQAHIAAEHAEYDMPRRASPSAGSQTRRRKPASSRPK